jgi:hypothetical protein
MPRRPHYRLVAARLRLLIATTTMTTMTPTRSRASPTLWRLNPDECTDVANLKITPTTASTIPIAISQMPDLVFTDPQPSLLAVRAFARTQRQDGALAAAERMTGYLTQTSKRLSGSQEQIPKCWPGASTCAGGCGYVRVVPLPMVSSGSPRRVSVIVSPT